MAVDLSPIDESLLATIANIHGMPKGAFNIRRDGKLVERHSSAYIDIETKTGVPGIDIFIKPGTKGESVFIPVIVTQAGLKDVVYNTFYVGEDCDVEIIAGCGIHNDSHKASDATAPAQASVLLKEAGFSMAACGFSDLSNAKRIFKSRFGMSMREWRNRQGVNGNS